METIKKITHSNEKIKKIEQNIIHLKKIQYKFQHSAFQKHPYISPNRLELICGESSFVASM